MAPPVLGKSPWRKHKHLTKRRLAHFSGILRMNLACTWPLKTPYARLEP